MIKTSNPIGAAAFYDGTKHVERLMSCRIGAGLEFTVGRQFPRPELRLLRTSAELNGSS